MLTPYLKKLAADLRAEIKASEARLAALRKTLAAVERSERSVR